MTLGIPLFFTLHCDFLLFSSTSVLICRNFFSFFVLGLQQRDPITSGVHACTPHPYTTKSFYNLFTFLTLPSALGPCEIPGCTRNPKATTGRITCKHCKPNERVKNLSVGFTVATIHPVTKARRSFTHSKILKWWRKDSFTHISGINYRQVYIMQRKQPARHCIKKPNLTTNNSDF